MSEAVAVVAVAIAVVNGIAGMLGAVSWYRERMSPPFWIALRAGQGVALLGAIAVGVLAAAGKRPAEDLFYLYALLPLAVAFFAEQLRILSAQTILDRHGLADAAAVGALPDGEQRALVAAIIRRETGVMTLSALVVCFLALRAAATAHGFG